MSTLRTSSLDRESSSELLAIIEEEADHLDQLVARSVEMSQLDTLDVTMNFSPQSLSEIVEKAVQVASQLLLNHPVEVTIPIDMPQVEADPVWLGKLMGNLLENAAKYSAVGSPIFITAERRGDLVACSVADRGVGIDPLEQTLIFDKFYRSQERAANVSGTGMGLAICRAIIEEHGGTLQVTSQPGYGSVFTITLRIAD